MFNKKLHNITSGDSFLNAIDYRLMDYHIELMFKATQERNIDFMGMRRFKRSHYRTISDLVEQFKRRR